MFNALKYTEELEKAGFTRAQAEASLKLLVDTMNENFATKADFKELKWEMQSVETRLDSKILALDSKFESKFQSLESSIKEMEYKLTIKLGTMMALSIGITGTLVTLLHH
jgi:hypothetical protein